MRLFNILYPLLILLLLFFNYVYEIIVCEGKLNVVTDTRVRFRVYFSLSLKPRCSSSVDNNHDDYHLSPDREFHTSQLEFSGTTTTLSRCEHKQHRFSRLWPYIYYLHFTGRFTFCCFRHRFHLFSRDGRRTNVFSDGKSKSIDFMPGISLLSSSFIKVFIRADQNMRKLSPARVIRRLK